MNFDVLAVGTPAPDFELTDLAGRLWKLGQARGAVLVLNFWSAECPWAGRGDDLLTGLSAKWGDDVLVWWIASNANETVDLLSEVSATRGIGPVLLDPDQAVADAYGAVTTPHLYILDGEGVLRYRGAPDDVSWAQKQASRDYLTPAVAAARQGRSPDPASTPAFGCSLVRFKPEA
jgi:hypothetical protein